MGRIFIFLHSKLLILMLVLGLSSCGENTRTPSYNPDIGPFDENGNYVEAWADNPPKKRWFRKYKDSEPEKPKKKKATAKPKSEPKKKVERPKRPEPPLRVEQTKQTSKAKPKPATKPKPKPVKKKPVKVQPKFRYHRVTRKDTLYGLARKYGTTITAIKKANGLRSNTIITGSTLKIPRK